MEKSIIALASAKSRCQKGMALIAVIFILVALGAIGVAVSKITGNQASDAVNAIQVQNAYYAANSGIDWAWQQAKDNPTLFNADYSSGTKSLPGGSTFSVVYVAATDALTSTSSKNQTTRVMTFNAFKASAVPGGGGGGGPYPTCSGSNPVDDTKTWFAQAASSNGIVQNVNLPSFNLPSAPSSCSGSTCQSANSPTYYDGNNTLPSSSSVTSVKISGTMRLDNNAQLVINGPSSGTPLSVFISNDLRLEGNARITVNGNVRFIVSSDFKMDNNAQIVLGTGANLLVMTGQDVNFDNNAFFNSGGSPSNALIMAKDTVFLNNNTNVKSGIYARDNVTLDNNSSVTGAVVSDNRVSRQSGATVTYNSTVSTSVQNSISGC